jgi:hypothetical protein
MLTVRLSDTDRLLLTRERGREVAARIPSTTHEVVFDFENVEVASSSFLDELMKQLIEERHFRVSVMNVPHAIAQNIERLRRVAPNRPILEIA